MFIIFVVYLIHQQYSKFTFQSQTKKNSYANLHDLNTSKYLLIFLATKYDKKQQPYTNLITIGLSTKNLNCTFQFEDKLCIFQPNTFVDKQVLKIQCQKTPCKIQIMARTQNKTKLKNQQKIPFQKYVYLEKCIRGQISLIGGMLSNLLEVKIFYQVKPVKIYIKQHLISLFFQNKIQQQINVLFFILKQNNSYTFSSLAIPFDYQLSQKNSYQDILLSKNVYKLEINKQKYLYWNLNVQSVEQKGDISFQVKQLNFIVDIGVTQNTQNMLHTILIDPKLIKKNKITVILKSNLVFRLDIYYQQTTNLQIEVNQILFTEISGNYTVKYLSEQIKGKKPMNLTVQNYFDQQSNEQIKQNITYHTVPDKCFYGQDCKININIPQGAFGSMCLKQSMEKIQNHQFIKLQLSNPYVVKMHQQQKIYFVFINSHKDQPKLISVTNNIIAYVSWTDQCKYPNEDCAQLIGNKQEPVIISGNAKQKQTFFICIQSSSNSYQTILIQQKKQEPPLLKSSIQYFSYIHKQQQKIFTYKVQKQDKDKQIQIYINGPTNYLIVYVNVGSQVPDADSYDYIGKQSITINDQNKQILTITVSQTQQQGVIPFSIVVVVQNSIRILHNNIPIISNNNNNKKSYLLILNPNVQAFLNFEFLYGNYSQIEIELIKLNKKVKLNTTHIYNTYDISKLVKGWCQSQDQLEQIKSLIDIKFQQQQQMCHIVLNTFSKQSIKYKLTLFQKNRSTQIKDGIRLTYNLSYIDKQSHFYFIPKHYNYTQNIFFYSSTGRVNVFTKIWKLDKHLSKDEYPYPKIQNQQNNIVQFSHSKTITPSMLKECKPNCAILFSVSGFDIKQNNQIIEIQNYLYNYFSIIISSKHFTIQDNQRINIGLIQKENKIFTYSLKRFFEEQAESILIQVDQIVGAASITVSVSSPSKPRYPSILNYDFFLVFTGQISKNQIMKIIKNQSYQINNTQLNIDIECDKGYKQAQIVIMISCRMEKVIYLMEQIAQVANISQNKHEIFLYRNQGISQFKLKFQKTSGFPQIVITSCNISLQIQQCIEQIEQLKDTQKQMISKNYEIVIDKNFKHYCLNICNYLVMVYAPEQSAIIDIYVVPKYGHIILQQSIVFNDFGNKDQVNTYQITGKQNKQTIITISILQGQLSLNLDIPFFNKSYPYQKGNPIKVIVPPINKIINKSSSSIQINKQQQKLLQNYLTLLGKQLIGEIHSMYAKIKCSTVCSYTISYSTGNNNIFLTDGLLTMGIVKKGSKTQYSYLSNKIKSLVIISFIDQKDMKLCNITYQKFKNNKYTNPISANPIFQKNIKINLPTIVFQLNQVGILYLIKIQTQSLIQIPFSIIVSQLDMIYIPFQTVIPISAQSFTSNYFQTTIMNNGYLSIQVRLCSRSQLIISYTTDYQQLIDGKYDVQTKLTNGFYNNIFKVNRGSFFLKISTKNQQVLYTVELKYFQDKKNKPVKDIGPGNKGNLQYQITAQKTAKVFKLNKITFMPVVCDCDLKEVDYFLLTDTKQKNVLAQSSCPTSYFIDHKINAIKPIHLSIKDKAPYSVPYHLKNDIEYVSIKAVIKIKNGTNIEVPYNTIELVTTWGSVHKRIMVCLCGYCVLCRRKPHKTRYQNLQQDEL